MTDAELVELFLESARGAGRRAPLYHRLAMAIADDPPTARLLLHAPPEQRMPVLLYACVHWILLREPHHELCRWYPNLAANHPNGPADRPADGDPYPAFRRFCAEHADRLAELLSTRTTQTNEIGRCVLFVPVLAGIAAEHGPLAVLDVGASAGLNLLLDRYRYRYEDGDGVDQLVGGTTTPVAVELRCGIRGPVPVPEATPPIVDRIGLDRSPIDVTVAEEADWLRACVWPDQADRFERLGAALELARDDPPRIVTGDAVDDLITTAGRLDPDAHLVVIDSWALNYLDQQDRIRFVETLETLGRAHDLSWCCVESPGLTPELPWPRPVTGPHLTHVLRAEWHRGRRSVDHLATAHPHGYWLHWSQDPG